MDDEPEEVSQLCFACGVDVVVPVLDGQLANLYKCGHCMALNTRHCGGVSESCSTPKLRLPQVVARVLRFFQRNLGTLSLIFVGILITVIASCGFIWILPTVYTSAVARVVNFAWGLTLFYNVMWNYILAVRTAPGPVKDHVVFHILPGSGQGTRIPSGAFEGCSWCKACNAVKPPQAHHCSTCKQCVVDMDHHCPYINNCVGRANIRPFLLFLFWVSVVGIYGAVCCLLYLRNYWPTLITSKNVMGDYLNKYWIPYVAMYYAARVTPMHLLVVMYLLVVCTVLGLTVGGLLAAQLRYVMLGYGFVTALKTRKTAGKKRAVLRWENMQHVFGNGHLGTWLWPMKGQPPGALVLSHIPAEWTAAEFTGTEVKYL